MTIFYSQCKEDEILLDRFFEGHTNGTFIEMGALDGILYSNTKFFEDHLGWTGILIEPNPIQFEKLQVNRPKCKNFNSLVSDSEVELDYKFFHEVHAAVSGVELTLPSSHNDIYFDNHPELNQTSIKIKPRKLTDIVKESEFDNIDFFSLDVEGHELQVLRSYDFSIPIKLILIENNPSSFECDKLLVEKGYVFMENCAHNKIYVHKNFLSINLK